MKRKNQKIVSSARAIVLLKTEKKSMSTKKENANEYKTDQTFEPRKKLSRHRLSSHLYTQL